MTGCHYLFTINKELDCTNPDAENEGCPFLDAHDVECILKEGRIGNIEDWAITQLAGDRKDRYARVRELMVADMGGE